MSTRLDDLDPRVMFMARAGIAILGQHNIPHVVTATRRTKEEQVALFKKGVTKCDGVKYVSNHQIGKALDVVPAENGSPVWPSLTDPRWTDIAEVMKGQGFKWGGDWKDFPDFPHYELGDIAEDFNHAQGVA